MGEPGPTITCDLPDGRELSTSCEHGSVIAFDSGPQWSSDQLFDFASAVLSARARCDCHGDRVWFPPTRPEHVELELRLFKSEQPDPDIERERPAFITPIAVSLAAHRYYESHTPDDHPLEHDQALVRWWYAQRQLGALPRDAD